MRVAATLVRQLWNRVDRDDLDWLVQQLWDTADAEAQSTPSFAPPVPAAHDHHVVLAGRNHPFVVVPGLGRRAAVRALLARPRLQSRSNLSVRVAAAAALTISGTSHGLGHRLSSAGRGDAAGKLPAGTVLGEAASALGQDLWALVVLGKRDPNRKPTVELTDRAGRTVGFAKVGWNAPTRALVAHEADWLRRLQAEGSQDLPAVPRVLAELSLHGHQVVVTEPLPSNARAWPNHASPPLEAVAAIARSGARGHELPSARLRDVLLWEGMRAELALAAAEPGLADATGALSAALDASLERSADVLVPYGAWHGDLTPWNLASAGGRIWAWDWEHAETGVPLGFDVVHYRFQVAVDVENLSVADAVESLWRTLPRDLAALSVPEEAARALVVGYLVTAWLRGFRLQVDGTGWNPVIHPGIVDFLSGRR